MFRVLKIDRTEPKELHIVDDQVLYIHERVANHTVLQMYPFIPTFSGFAVRSQFDHPNFATNNRSVIVLCECIFVF